MFQRLLSCACMTAARQRAVEVNIHVSACLRAHHLQLRAKLCLLHAIDQ